jgi:protein FAM32A
MPASDYTSTVSGGLKLKGGAKDSGIKKKKKSGSSSKKKSAPEPTTTQDEQGAKSEEPQAAAGESSTALARQPQIDEDDEEQALENRRSRSGSAVPTNIAGSGKTEAQRRHEEIKRKRVSWRIAKTSHLERVLTDVSRQLDERLRREGGAKTHKQRVEELNKYLSTLSEHHDMPRIGPG